VGQFFFHLSFWLSSGPRAPASQAWAQHRPNEMTLVTK
jgi:hypothetical protein